MPHHQCKISTQSVLLAADAAAAGGVMQDGGRLSELHPADARRLCDTVQHSLRVVDGNISTLNADVEMLREARHGHVDALQHRSIHDTVCCLSVSL